MPPEETPSRIPDRRPPLPRRPVSVDGLSMGRPLQPQRPAAYVQRDIVQPPLPEERVTLPTPDSTPEQLISEPPVVVAEPHAGSPTLLPTTPFVPQKVSKDHRKIRNFLAIGLIGFGIGVGLFVLIRVQLTNNKPDKIFNDALQNSLSTTGLQADSHSDKLSNQVVFNFSDAKNPIVSSQATIELDGSSFGVKAYGTTKNTYVNYSKLPSNLTPALSSVVKDAWIQLRADSVPALGVPADLSHVGDPRFQAFGPIIFGNLKPQARNQLISFINAHHVYEYKNQVAHRKIGDTNALVFQVKINVSDLKVANQSAAVSEGFDPADIQESVAALDSLKSANLQVAIDASNHRVIRVDVTKDTITTTTNYGQYDSAPSATEPQTKLAWANFATYQFQMESQLASHQLPQNLDAVRLKQLKILHGYLASYFAQSSSYPSLANLNNQTWIATNLAGLDPSLLRDPTGANLTLLNTPKAGNLAYQPLPLTGKGICDNTPDNPCSHFKLTATLSNNQPSSVQDP